MNVTTNESCRERREDLANEDMDIIEKLSTFMASVLDTDQRTLAVQLQNNQVQQSSLGQCLLHGFQMVQRKTSDLSHVLSALKLLLQFGAKWDRSALLEDQMTPYHIICQCPDDQHEILELIIKADDGELLDAKDFKGTTPLLFAVVRNNFKCVKSLIKHGADINYVREHSPSSYGYIYTEFTPLITAINLFDQPRRTSSMRMDIFNFLLESGADVSKPDCNKRTPLMHAAWIHAFECIEKLVQNGARVDEPDQRDLVVFGDAALAPSLDSFKCLFDSVVDKNATNQDGVSILHFVVSTGNIAAVRYILSHGAMMIKNMPTQYDQPHYWLSLSDPLRNAITHNRMDIVKLLDENNCEMTKSLYTLRSAVHVKNKYALHYLLSKYKYPLNQEYRFDSDTYITVLAEACGSTDVVKMLLDHGADPNKKSSKKQYVSPLHTAIIKYDVSTVACLIRSGADINYRSFDSIHGNLLPFEASALYNYRFYAAEMLISSGCSCGTYSLTIDEKIRRSTRFRNLARQLNNWNFTENNVRSLYELCRTVILKQLSPAASKKIGQLPLPKSIIKFIGIPELDDILDNQARRIRLNSGKDA